MEIMGVVIFTIEDGKIRSKYEINSKFFGNNEKIVSNIMEGLHYDLLHRMKSSKLIDFSYPENG